MYIGAIGFRFSTRNTTKVSRNICRNVCNAKNTDFFCTDICALLKNWQTAKFSDESETLVGIQFLQSRGSDDYHF